MYIEELKEGEGDGEEGEGKSVEEQFLSDLCDGAVVVSGAKQIFVRVGARALFYPTLLYNVVRNMIQSEFHWWDRVDEFVLLGAVPFPTDVPQLKELGVGGVVTLNESYETLVPTSLYHAHDINHLVIPTTDYLFAPSYGNICQAVNFIHENASCGKTTYVHCKAGRGRSTTIVLCYLVEHKQMTPDAAHNYVRSVRPRIRLAFTQWQAVQDYYLRRVKKSGSNAWTNNLVKSTLGLPAKCDLATFDDGSVVVVTESDLDGYDETLDSGLVVGNNKMLAELSLVYKVQFAGQAAIARLSCTWLRCHASRKMSGEKLGTSVSTTDHQLGSIGVDIRVY